MKVTSILVETRGAHDHVTVWVDGANSGTLIVGEGDGRSLVALIVGAENWEDVCASCGSYIPEGIDEYTGCPGRVCDPCHREWSDGQRESPEF